MVAKPRANRRQPKIEAARDAEAPAMPKRQIPPRFVGASCAISDPRVKTRHWRCLAALGARYNQKTRQCFPSIDTIAEDTNLCRRTVFKVLDDLRKWEYISWKKRTDQDGKPISNQYVIHGVSMPNGGTPKNQEVTTGFVRKWAAAVAQAEADNTKNYDGINDRVTWLISAATAGTINPSWDAHEDMYIE